MGLAETAQLLVKLMMQDEASGPAGKAKTSISDLGKTALAVGGAAGFAALTKGALDAEAAQGKFMAATGRSREEAKQFVSGMDSLAGTSGAVGKSFEEIAAAGTTVSQQFGITGQKATDLTGKILEFSKVTGSDATQTAGQLEDTLSAMGLSADDAAGFMDTLVASSQKYGTDVGPEMLSNLQQMAPALQTMGLNANDAVGFLNAMETAGIDSNAAVKDLTAVIKNFPPGTTLDDVVAKLGAVEDPAKRGQLAVELLGQKAGPQLALLVKPGMKSLDDFGVSATDAAGKLDQASDDMLTTSDKIRGLFDKLGAGARELGQQFGPAVTGIASVTALLGPLAGKFGGLLKDLGKKLLPQATATGLEVGTAMAAGEAEGAAGAGAVKSIGARIAAMGTPLAAAAGPIGIALAAGVVVAFGPAIFDKLTGNDVSSRVNAAGTALADKFAAGYSDEVKAQFAAKFQSAFNTAMDQRSLWDKITQSGVQEAAQSAVTTAQAYLHTLSGEITDHGADDAREGFAQANLAASFANDQALAAAGISAGSAITTATTSSIQAGFNAESQRWAGIAAQYASGARQIGAVIPRSIALGMEQNIGDVRDEWKQYVKDLNQPFDAMKEISFLNGKLAGNKLAEGLNSTDPITRARAAEMRDHIQDRLNDLKALGYDIGDGTGTQVAAGIDDSTPDAVNQANQLKNQVNAKLSNIKTDITIKITKSGAVFDTTPSNYGGPRALGGPVAGGGIYEVNERGDPETLTTGGRTFLLMGRQPGYVKPMGGPGGGGWSGAQPMGGPGGGGWSGAQPIVNVYITARDIENVSHHRRVLQGSGAGFR